MFKKHASKTKRLTSGRVMQDGSVVAIEVGGRGCALNLYCQKIVMLTVKSDVTFIQVDITEHVISAALLQQ